MITSSSSYALYKHGSGKTIHHLCKPLFPVVMIGTKQKTPGEQAAREETEEFNLRGSAFLCFPV